MFLRHIPRILITDTWQVMWAIAMMGMGITTAYNLITGQSGAMGQALPSVVLRSIWAGSFFLGGILQLVGIQVEARRLERLGMNLCGLACTVYAVILFSIDNPQATAFGVVFALTAGGYGIRILISNLARSAARANQEEGLL